MFFVAWATGGFLVPSPLCLNTAVFLAMSSNSKKSEDVKLGDGHSHETSGFRGGLHPEAEIVLQWSLPICHLRLEQPVGSSLQPDHGDSSFPIASLLSMLHTIHQQITNRSASGVCQRHPVPCLIRWVKTKTSHLWFINCWLCLQTQETALSLLYTSLSMDVSKSKLDKAPLPKT